MRFGVPVSIAALLTDKDVETAAFNVFLYSRVIGAAAEI
jgi:hypothetical protein